jgi:alpha-D-ribose 1-methylphosphonate 5-triphosphate synthase subunit PhnG
MESRKMQIKAALQAVIAEAEAGELEAVLDAIWAEGDLAVRQAPQGALVMMTVRDPFDTDFYLGEVLITSAQVARGEITGYGALMGDAPQAALLLAAVEALQESRLKDRLIPVLSLSERLAQRLAQRRQTLGRMAAATAVQFESMRKERVDFGSLGG